MVVYAPAQIISAPAQLITAPAQLPATGAVVYTALFVESINSMPGHFPTRLQFYLK